MKKIEALNDMSVLYYREHRGTLADSLKTTRAVNGTGGLRAIIEREHGQGEIKIKEYGFDQRIARKVYIVTINGCACGFLWRGALTDRA